MPAAAEERATPSGDELLVVEDELVLHDARVGLQPVRKQRRRGWAVTIALAALLLTMPLWGSAVLGSGGTIMMLVAVLLGGLCLSVVYLAGIDRGPGERRCRPGSLRVTEEAITVELGERRHRFARDQVAGGWGEDAEDVQAAVLRIDDGTLLTVVPGGAASVERVLERAGCRDRAVAIAVPRSSTATRRWIGCAVGCWLPFALFGVLGLVALVWHDGLSVSLLFAALAVAVTGFPVVRLLPSAVVVGTDGVRLKRPLRRSLFLPYPRLDEVDQHLRVVRFVRDDGRRWRIKTASYQQAAAVVERIEQAICETSSEAKGIDLAVLERRDRSLGRWRAGLTGLLAQASYRERAVGRADLMAVVGDGQALPERRVAAAFALASLDDEALGERLRAVIAGCANPDLKAALELSLAGELDAGAIAKASLTYE